MCICVCVSLSLSRTHERGEMLPVSPRRHTHPTTSLPLSVFFPLHKVDDVRSSFTNSRPYVHIVPPKPLTTQDSFKLASLGSPAAQAARASSVDHSPSSFSSSSSSSTSSLLHNNKQGEKINQRDMTLSMVDELNLTNQSIQSESQEEDV
jgi:hypothetical protein